VNDTQEEKLMRSMSEPVIANFARYQKFCIFAKRTRSTPLRE